MIVKKITKFFENKFSGIIQRHKPLFRPFIFLFIFFVIVLNFNQIIWVFNKRAVDDAVKGMMESSKIIESIKQQEETGQSISFNGSQSNQEGELKPITEIQKNYILEGSYLEIPKIGIKADISFPVSDSLEEVNKALIGHAMHFPGSAFPGEKGDVFFLSHSAPLNWSADYRIFNNINQLESGDTILAHFNNRTYRYIVVKNFIIKPGESIAPSNESAYSMHLMTCWPPGKSLNRMVVEAIMDI
ncbi:MAG TPA: sortase [Candidatus Pacearchaeota archaeon]|nr:sortase [Candidatus Pacearchaeota archaeon]